MEPGIRVELIGEKKGRGVIAVKGFKKGEVIERAPVLLMPSTEDKYVEKTVLDNYWFEWKEGWSAIVFGYGSIYNHSFENTNARFDPDFEKNEMVFTAIKDIAPGEEICTNYNGEAEDKEFIDWLPNVIEGRG